MTTGDGESEEVTSVAVVTREKGAVMSDHLASLSIVILDPASGRWRFRDELGFKVRASFPKSPWL